MEKDKLWFLFRFLHEVEESISPEAEKQVMIEKAINLRLMCDYVVSCSYGDVVLSYLNRNKKSSAEPLSRRL